MVERDDDALEDDDGILPRLFEIEYAGGVVAGKKGMDTLGIGGYSVRLMCVLCVEGVGRCVYVCARAFFFSLCICFCIIQHSAILSNHPPPHFNHNPKSTNR